MLLELLLLEDDQELFVAHEVGVGHAVELKA